MGAAAEAAPEPEPAAPAAQTPPATRYLTAIPLAPCKAKSQDSETAQPETPHPQSLAGENPQDRCRCDPNPRHGPDSPEPQKDAPNAPQHPPRRPAALLRA